LLNILPKRIENRLDNTVIQQITEYC